MKKSVAVFLVLAIVLSSFFVFAQNDINDSVVADDSAELQAGFDKAEQCLIDQIEDVGADNLTPEEQALSLLALSHNSGSQSDLINALEDSGDECWPDGSCTLKETAIATLAFERIGKNTDDQLDWLLDQSGNTRELVWFLQIDQLATNEETECTITAKNSSRDITISGDKRLSGSGGACFRTAFNGYWLEVDNDCYSEEFEITCDQEFATSLIFRKKGGTKFFVSSITNTRPSGGTTTEKVESLCFKQGNSCDYEGSLWSILTIAKLGEEHKPYLPYLIALSEDNERELPSAFLYMITGFDEYFSELIKEQQTEGFWQASGSSSKRFYDTALALLALQSRSSEQADRAIDYLIEVQPASGCWQNSIRDTAFLIYSTSEKKPATVSGIDSPSFCEDFGHSCEAPSACEDANGDKLTNFRCFGGDICCSVTIGDATCSQKDGTICLSSETCDGDWVSKTSDTSFCCVGTCVESQVEENECEAAGFSCKSFCGESEDERNSYSCTGSEICCVVSAAGGGGGGGFLIFLLIILIILVIVAILYRKRIKIWIEQRKLKKGKKGPQPPIAPGRFPPGPPRGPPRGPPQAGIRRPLPRPMRRPLPPPRPGARPPRRPYPKQTELDQTLKKLKDMSK